MCLAQNLLDGRVRILRAVLCEKHQSLSIVGRKGAKLVIFGEVDRSLQMTQGIMMAPSREVESRNGQPETKLIEKITAVLCLPENGADFVCCGDVALQKLYESQLASGSGLEVGVCQLTVPARGSPPNPCGAAWHRKPAH